MTPKILSVRTLSALCVCIVLLFVVLQGSAQEKINVKKWANSVRKLTIDGKKFEAYSVVKGDTPYSISKKFDVSVEDIYLNNPHSKEGIHEGDLLKIPRPVVTQSPQELARNYKRLQYIVGPKETLYSIARRFNTTQEEILRLNPLLKGSLKKGTVLLIWEKPAEPEVKPNPAEAVATKEYKIVHGDNFFQFEKKYGISQAELEKLNPSLKDGFNTGMVIQIPARIVIQQEVAKEAEIQVVKEKGPAVITPVPPVVYNNVNKTFEIGVFLPFCQNLPDSARVAQRGTSFLEFYSGVLLATEKSAGSGIKVKLNVYDTYQDSGTVDKLVSQPEFLSLDLVIGPVYADNQKVVADLCAKNRIPMISPLSSDRRFVSTTPGYYQINPGREIRLLGTADYICDKFVDQNIIMLDRGINTADEKILPERIIQRIGAEKLIRYNIMSEGTEGLAGLLKSDKENIIVLTDGNEADVSVTMSRLNTISKTNKITVIGLQEYTRMQSINIEYLHNTNLQYLAPYFVDYTNSRVNSFISRYRSAFGGEPTSFSFQGYDIASYFIASLRIAGKNFPENNPNPGIELLQSAYDFQKSGNFGGYVNRALYILQYSDSYDVRCIGKIAATIASDYGSGQPNKSGGLEQ